MSKETIYKMEYGNISMRVLNPRKREPKENGLTDYYYVLTNKKYIPLGTVIAATHKNCIICKTEVSLAVYKALTECDRKEYNANHKQDRHKGYTPLLEKGIDYFTTLPDEAETMEITEEQIDKQFLQKGVYLELTERQKKIFDLKYIADNTQQDIAETVGVSQATVHREIKKIEAVQKEVEQVQSDVSDDERIFEECYTALHSGKYFPQRELAEGFLNRLDNFENRVLKLYVKDYRIKIERVLRWLLLNTDSMRSEVDEYVSLLCPQERKKFFKRFRKLNYQATYVRFRKATTNMRTTYYRKRKQNRKARKLREQNKQLRHRQQDIS